jgi:hypothetical protein
MTSPLSVTRMMNFCVISSMVAILPETMGGSQREMDRFAFLMIE